MKTPIVLPQLGNEVEEAQIDKWQKAIGDKVEKGEALLSITTPKVTIEVDAPVSGTLAEILVEADDIARVGDTLGFIIS